LRAHLRIRLRTKSRTKPSSTARRSRCECGAGSLCGNELSRRAGVAADVAAHWTVADCGFGKFFGENSSFAFCSGPRLSAIALAKAGKRNDMGAKVCVTDTRCRSRLGQQAGLGHAGNGVDLQNVRLSVLG